ncbi:MAG: AAA family ATPase [Thermaceae bacterium]|nr:AAA family ATPase [Thermaceae bacterium]
MLQAAPENPVPTPSWALGLLGRPRLLGPAGETHLERKPAAVLAYLALEGRTPRADLAGLLWPQVGSSTARGNLRKLLSRLRDFARGELVITDAGENARLREGVEVDAQRLQLLAFDGENAAAARLEGALLEGLVFDDAPDFDEWLVATRERLRAVWMGAVAAAAEWLEAEGRYQGALEMARKLTTHDPLSEEACRRVMRLHYRLGDRGAALSAYERLRQTLRLELGVEPLPQTAELATRIGQGRLPNGPTAQATPVPIPTSALRPPRLVGREREWAMMEEAWRRGQSIFLAGEPGAGKSRLAWEFAASKGEILALEGRLGDRDVPYATLVRNQRRAIAKLGAENLPGWVRAELARLLPELRGDIPPRPLADEADKLRFYEACAEVVRRTHLPGLVHVVDDLQFYDAATAEFGAYLHAKAEAGEMGGALRYVYAYRKGELSGRDEAALRQLEGQGLATLIEVGPLGEEAVGELLDSLGVAGLAPLAGDVARFSGGSPLYVLEAAKYLVEGGLAVNDQGLQALASLRPVIRRRLQRLSPEALKLAQVGAVAGEDFSPELAAAVLGQDPLGLAGAWAELEGAQILTGSRFSHDLIQEAQLAELPQAIHQLLHRRVADFLRTHHAGVERAAAHYLRSEAPGEAAPLLLEAARAAEDTLQFRHAARLYDRAAELLEASGKPGEAFEALYAHINLLDSLWVAGEAAAPVEHLQALAQTPLQRAKAWFLKARIEVVRGRGAEVERAARQGLELLIQETDEKLEVRLLSTLGEGLRLQGRVGEALSALERAQQIHLRHGDEVLVAVGQANIALGQAWLTRHQEALDIYHDVIETFRKRSERLRLAHVLNNAAVSAEAVGDLETALRMQREGQEALRGLPDLTGAHLVNRLAQAHLEVGLERYGEALAHCGWVARQTVAGWGKEGILERTLAAIYQTLGGWEQAEEAIHAALSHPVTSDPWSGETYTWLGVQRAREGRAEEAKAAFKQAEAALQGPVLALPRGRLWLEQARFSPPEAMRSLAARALELSMIHRLDGLRSSAELRLAQAFLALDQPAQALVYSQAAMERLSSRPPYAAQVELRFTHYRVLEALGDAGAAEALEGAVRRLVQVAWQTPEEYRADYLGLHAELIQAVRRAGLGHLLPE